MRHGGPETAFNPLNNKWGVTFEHKPVLGTFVHDTELEALELARCKFPFEDPCLVRDWYHSQHGRAENWPPVPLISRYIVLAQGRVACTRDFDTAIEVMTDIQTTAAACRDAGQEWLSDGRVIIEVVRC